MKRLALAALAACGGAQHAAPAAPPTQPIADYVTQHGKLTDDNGAYALTLSRADGCSIDLTWDASMKDTSTLHYQSTFDLHLVQSISIDPDPETGKQCIKVVTGNKTVHMQIQANIPGNPPIDTPMDDDSWGVCTEDRAFLDGLSTSIRSAATSCGAPLH